MAEREKSLLEIRLDNLVVNNQVPEKLVRIYEKRAKVLAVQDLELLSIGEKTIVCKNELGRRISFLKNGVARGGMMNGFLTVRENTIKKPANRMANSPYCSMTVILCYNENGRVLLKNGHYHHNFSRWILSDNKTEILSHRLNWWGYIP